MISEKIGHFILLCLSLLLFSLPASADERKHLKVLVLHSYHKEFDWTNSVMDGIHAEMAASGLETDFYVEYMDTKRTLPKTVFPILESLYRAKYQNTRFDIIITSDDNALNFLMERRAALFPGVPIVFCGINYFTDSLIAGQKNITGVVESVDIKGTIELITRLFPQTKKIVVIHDDTPTSLANARLLTSAAPQFTEELEFIIYTGLTEDELKDNLAGLPSDSAVLLFSFFRGKNGKQFNQKEYISLVTGNSAQPVFSLWDDYLGKGILGGIVTSGHEQGKYAARLAIRALKGEMLDRIAIITESPNIAMFDYAQLERFNLDKKDLPAKSVIINMPSSLYRDHKDIVLTVSGLFAFLIISLIAISANVVKRKKAEEALRISNEQLETRVKQRTVDLEKANAQLKKAQKIGRLGSWELDLKTNTVIASDETYAIYGVRPEEIEPTKKGFMGRVHADDRKRVEEALYKSVMDNTPYQIEYRVPYSDGSEHVIDARGEVVLDTEGIPVLVSGMVHDITQYKQTIQALWESEEKFRTIVEQSPLSIQMMQSDGHTIKVNGSFEKLWGITIDDLKGYCMLQDRQLEQLGIMPYIKKAFSGEATFIPAAKYDVKKTVGKGASRWVQTYIYPVKDERGNIRYVVLMHEDITKRIKMENQIKSSLQEKEVLLREIHHRVKNNMTVVYSLLNLQSNAIAEDRNREILNDAKSRIKAMALIHEKLYQSKDMAKIDFNDYLSDVLNDIFMNYKTDSANIALNVDIRNVALTIDDAIPCGLIVNELVSNALKHAFPGGRKGKIEVKMLAGDNNTFEMSVADDGIGLPHDLDIKKTTSLGLNLVDALAKQLQGTLKLFREAETKFVITFGRHS